MATSVQKDTRTSFVVFMSPAGIRFTHPDPARIGGRFLGDIDAARRGKSLTETYEGTLGESVRAVVPIKDDGRVVGLVSVGILLRQVSAQTSNQIPILVGLAVLALAIGTVGSVLLARRVRRQTLGLDPAEIARQYQHNDAVLHAVREGVLIVDGERRLTLANDEARRLLDLPHGSRGHQRGPARTAPAHRGTAGLGARGHRRDDHGR